MFLLIYMCKPENQASAKILLEVSPYIFSEKFLRSNSCRFNYFSKIYLYKVCALNNLILVCPEGLNLTTLLPRLQAHFFYKF